MVALIPVVLGLAAILAVVLQSNSRDRPTTTTATVTATATKVMTPTITVGDRSYLRTATHEQQGCQGLGTEALEATLHKIDCGTVVFGRYRSGETGQEVSAAIFHVDDKDQFAELNKATDLAEGYLKVLLADGSLGPLGQDGASHSLLADQYLVYAVVDMSKEPANGYAESEISESNKIVEDVHAGLVKANNIETELPVDDTPDTKESQVPVTVSGMGAMPSTITAGDRSYRLTATHEQRGCRGLGTGILAPVLDSARCETVTSGRYSSSVAGWEAAAIIIRLDDEKQLKSVSDAANDPNSYFKVLLPDGSIGLGGQGEKGEASQSSTFDRYLVYVVADRGAQEMGDPAAASESSRIARDVYAGLVGTGPEPKIYEGTS